MNNGRAYTVGDNSQGQIGDNTLNTASSAVAVSQVGNFAGKTVITGCLAQFATFLVTDEATSNVYAIGSNVNGLLGINSNDPSARKTPVQVDTTGVLASKMVTKVSCTSASVVAMTTDRILVSWGANFYGSVRFAKFFKSIF